MLSALRERCRELDRELEVTLYTSVPSWFFEESLDFSFRQRDFVCDVGLVQKSALEEDLPATADRLERFWAETESVHRRDLPEELRAARTEAVVCDIAPLGLVAARDAGLPSILIESFTWDWIYEPLALEEPRLAPWVSRMRELFSLADLRIRAEPHCAPAGDAPTEPHETPNPVSSFPSMRVFPVFSASSKVDVEVSSIRESVVDVPPIARRPRSTSAEVRARLGLAPQEAGRPMVLVSMGGIPWSFERLERWSAAAGVDFVAPGGAENEERRGNLVLLPHHSPVFHPDLVAAADVVVGKLGYSTVAEAVAAGARYLYLPRPGFREHPVLARFVDSRLAATEISLDDFRSGRWLEELAALLARPRGVARDPGGAEAAASAIFERLGR